MRRVANPIPEPASFKEKCERPGGLWLSKNLQSDGKLPKGVRPKDLWSPFLPFLADGFSNLCGFGAMFVGKGTIDHWISCIENPKLAYQWNNYRYLDSWVNASKNKCLSSELLDPFEVQDGWFEIVLPSLQLQITSNVPLHLKAKAENTLKRLHLADC